VGEIGGKSRRTAILKVLLAGKLLFHWILCINFLWINCTCLAYCVKFVF